MDTALKLTSKEILDVEAQPVNREERLYFEVQRLRILLDRARAEIKLAHERAYLQRLHIAQLQNKLGIGVCREKRESKKKTAVTFDPARAEQGICQNPLCGLDSPKGPYCSSDCMVKHRWDCENKGDD